MAQEAHARNSILALREPEITGRTKPILPSGEWGINRAAAMEVYPDHGLEVFVPAWNEMRRGDVTVLLLDGKEVDRHVIFDEAEVGDRVTLFVAPRHLATGSKELTYWVEAGNNARETFTPPVKIYVKLEIPGGQDTDEGPGHSNLFMHIPEEIVQGIVDSETADKGVPITIRNESPTGKPYPDIAIGDCCECSWGGVFISSAPVTAEQINDPAGNPITILVTRNFIEKAGDTDEVGLAVAFRVRDIVHNYSEDWCKETRIKVSLGTALLTAPIAKQAVNNVLDLDSLNDDAILAQIFTKAPEFEPGDIIELKVRGTTLEGDSVELKAPEQIVDNLPHVYEFALLNADLRKLVKTQVVFEYKVVRGTDTFRSKGQFVQVNGEAVRLEAPVAEDEKEGALNPDLPSTRVLIPQNDTFNVGDAIELVWFGQRPNGIYNPPLEWYFPNADELAQDDGFFIKVDGVHVKALEGGTLILSYVHWREEGGQAVGRTSRSAASLNVGEPRFELVSPIVEGEKDGALEPADLPNGVTRLIAPRSFTPTKPGDKVTYDWQGEKSGPHTDSIDITGLNQDRDIAFSLNAQFIATHLEPNRDHKVSVSYKIWRKETDTNSQSNPLTFSVGTAQEIKLPVASFSEAKEDQLSPDDVYPGGATVVIGESAALQTDDEITVTVVGKNTTTYPHTVLATEAGKELRAIKVPHAVIIANLEGSISMHYTVLRQTGSTDGPSNPSVYDIRRVIGNGPLKIMGARYNRSTLRASGATRILSAFNVTTGLPLQAQWKYPSDNDWVTAATWRDSKPQEPLQVRTSEDQVTLNPANIFGNGYRSLSDGGAAFVAHRDVGDVAGWGNADHGAVIPPDIIAMDDIVEVSCTRGAYAARRANGAVVAWGSATEGGSMTGIDPLGFVEVIGNRSAFAGLKSPGQVFAWGNGTAGGTVPDELSAHKDIVRVVAAGRAFAAIRASGNVVAWGLAPSGGDVPADIGEFTDIENVVGNMAAFAALRANGRIVGWGDATYGGAVPSEIAAMTDIIELTCATGEAFTARRSTGQIVAWGVAGHGGDIDPGIGSLTDIVEVSSTLVAFAARRGNGHVVAWGHATYGGAVPADIARLDDIVQVCGASTAFAALRKNGTVVAWGNATSGGDTTPVASELTQVLALYSNAHGFTALTADGRVVTWGHPSGGGDSSAVQDRLRGKVSYKATPASRGLALKASRWAELKAAPESLAAEPTDFP
ncbi:hypothetical protein [Pseudomonas atacamensis]|uniref:Alpha-tubulin suppressor-like RCC1 family protein n=1 Tax=Pseudomonas iranensis TaxID=2745503 RepID=A0AAU7F2Y8_9PSED